VIELPLRSTVVKFDAIAPSGQFGQERLIHSAVDQLEAWRTARLQKLGDEESVQDSATRTVEVSSPCQRHPRQRLGCLLDAFDNPFDTKLAVEFVTCRRISLNALLTIDQLS
jgi:hypothetical protein